MKNFTRNDLAELLSHRLNIPVDRAKGIAAHTIDILAEALTAGNTIEFRGFGVFDVVHRKPKIGRNPRKPNDGQYRIPARRVVRFRAGKHIFGALNPDE